MKVYKEVLYLSKCEINKPFEMAIEGHLITVEKQNNNIVIYFLYNPSIVNIYEFIIAETGVDIKGSPNSEYEYKGTFMFYNDSYVLHAFATLKEIIR